MSRRQVLGSMAVTSLVSWPGLGMAQTLIRRTPTQVLGPFYPVVKPADQDADMTMIAGKSGRAAGQLLYVTGRLMNRHGQAVAGARMEVWQANSHGRYVHPSDRNPAPLDPNFEGYALLTTDAQGRYRIKTIKPAGYPEDSGALRAPHIHFDITGKTNRLVTQMFFAGERLNDSDRFLQAAAANKERLIVALQPPTPDLESDAMLAV